MFSPEAVARYLAGEELPLAIERIATELDELHSARPEERRLTRAPQKTLIIQLNNPALIDSSTAVLRELAQIYSCRALLLVLNPNSEQEELLASVTALFPANAASENANGSEQILLLAGGASVARVAELAAPLVNADLPLVYYFAQGIPADTPVLDLLLNKNPQIIFDSFTAEDLGLTLARANALFETTQQIRDLNWPRLAPWLSVLEETLAQAEVMNAMNSVEKISFTVAGEGLDENQIDQPVLLLSWLAQRFAWELVETLDYAKGVFRAVWEKDGREIVAEIKNTRSTDTGLHALELSSQKDFALTLTRNESANGFILESKITRKGTLVYSQQTPEVIPDKHSRLLLNELQQQTQHEQYEKTLALATKLI